MNTFLYSTVAFFVLLSILVIIHELGHYLCARSVGVKVLRFAMGFGPILFSKKLGQDKTEWALCAIPLGGYVSMLDEREGSVLPEEKHRAFNQQSVWKRILIVLGGPVANLVLAVCVYIVLFSFGVEELRPLMGTPQASSPAAEAKIQAGEYITHIENQPINTWQEMRWRLLKEAADKDLITLQTLTANQEIETRTLDLSVIRKSGWEGDVLEHLGLRIHRPKLPGIIGILSPGEAGELSGLRLGDEILEVNTEVIEDFDTLVRIVRDHPGTPLDFKVLREGVILTMVVTPREVVVSGQTIGKIGVGARAPLDQKDAWITTVRYGLLDAFSHALQETADKAFFSLKMMGKMITGEVSWRNISGPLTIADYSGQSAKMGWSAYLKFIAMVSINLAILNLLPIPVLDGGHLLYYVLEIIRGRPLSEQGVRLTQKIGLFLLILLMVFAFYNDFNRLISN